MLTRDHAMFARSKITQYIVLSMGLIMGVFISGAALANEKLPKSERKQSAPTMAKFYKVDGSGRSKSDQVSVPTLSNPAAEKLETKSPSKPKPKRKVRSKDSAKTVNITINKSPKKYDQQTAWQCERAGFYYTKDGRCVAPAPAKRLGRKN